MMRETKRGAGDAEPRFRWCGSGPLYWRVRGGLARSCAAEPFLAV